MPPKDTFEITPELLLHGYAGGIFPMSESSADDSLFWVDPSERGVLPLDGFHISRSLARALRRDDYSVHTDRDFDGVVAACADRSDTWINGIIAALYSDLFRMGYAHSVEVYANARLIGGVYGVALGSAFFGESMFSRRTNGSKIALAWLVDILRLNGFTLFDTQFTTSHLISLGALEISRDAYHGLLERALQIQATFDPYPSLSSGALGMIQRNTQTS